MKNNKGKGIILGLSSLLYAILRMADIISNPIYILDILTCFVVYTSASVLEPINALGSRNPWHTRPSRPVSLKSTDRGSAPGEGPLAGRRVIQSLAHVVPMRSQWLR